jgi:hypothetical protein
MQKLNKLSNLLNKLGLNDESSLIKRIARDSDFEYLSLAEEAFQSLTGQNRQGYYEEDPDIGPMLQVCHIPSDFIYNKMSFKSKRQINKIELFVFRPLHPGLLSRYGFSNKKIFSFMETYNDSFRWMEGFHAEFEPIDDGAKILIYPNALQFSKIEANIDALANYSWLHILIQLDSSFKDYFNHEFSHVINYIRGFSEEELGHKEPKIYANSPDEIKSRVIEIFSALNKEIASGNLVLKNLISRKDYDGFIEYVFSKYKNIILPDLSNENTKEIYKQRLLNFFLELWNKNS